METFFCFILFLAIALAVISGIVLFALFMELMYLVYLTLAKLFGDSILNAIDWIFAPFRKLFDRWMEWLESE